MIQAYITDGETTVTFLTPEYGLMGWPLKVASKTSVKAHGRTRYGLVKEGIVVYVQGTSLADTYIKTQALISLMEKADRWAMGEFEWDQTNNEPFKSVRLGYQPQAGGATYETCVFGGLGEGTVSLPRGYQRINSTNQVDGIRLDFFREGLWVSTATETISGAPLLSGDDFYNFSFTASETESDSIHRIGLEAQNVLDEHYGFVFMAEAGWYGAISLFPGTIFTIGIERTSVPAWSFPTTYYKSRAFIKLKNTSTTRAWKLRIGAGTGIYTRTVIVPPNINDPIIISFPELRTPTPHTGLNLYGEPLDATGDQLELISSAAAFGESQVVYYENAPIPSSATATFIDPRILNAPSGIVAAGNEALPFTGNTSLSFRRNSGILVNIGYVYSSGAFANQSEINITSMERWQGAVLPQ